MCVGRYCQNDHISPHDDKVLERYTKAEYCQMMAPYLRCPPNKVPVPELFAQQKTAVFSREVALVYYLNKNWTVRPSPTVSPTVVHSQFARIHKLIGFA